MFCSKCGVALDSSASFCSSCGTPSGEEKKSDLDSVPLNTGSKKKLRVSDILTYVAAGLIVLFFGSATVGMITGNESSPNESSVDGVNSSTSESTDSSPSASMGDTLATASGVEVTAISIEVNPAVPNEFIVNSGDIKGELIALRLNVANYSNEEISISNNSVFGFIDDAEYEPIAIFSKSGDWYVFESLGPGLETVIIAYFDVPPGRALTAATFLTSAFLGEEAKFTF